MSPSPPPASTSRHRFRRTRHLGLVRGHGMATPHVAGAVALLLQRHPSWTVAQVKRWSRPGSQPVPRPMPTTREGEVPAATTRCHRRPADLVRRARRNERHRWSTSPTRAAARAPGRGRRPAGRHRGHRRCPASVTCPAAWTSALRHPAVRRPVSSSDARRTSAGSRSGPTSAPKLGTEPHDAQGRRDVPGRPGKPSIVDAYATRPAEWRAEYERAEIFGSPDPRRRELRCGSQGAPTSRAL